MIQHIRQFSIYSSFGLLSSSIGILTVPYLTRVLSPEEYGVVGIFMSILFFVTPMVSMSSEGLVAINRVNLKGSDYRSFANQYISFVLILSLITFVVCVVLNYFYEGYEVLIFCVPVVALLQSLFRMHSSELVQDKRSSLFGSYNLTLALCLLAMTYLCVSVYDLGWEGRVMALLFAEATLLIGRYFLTFESVRNYHFKISLSFVLELAKYGGPLLVLLVAAWIFNEADRFIVLKFLTLKDVGIYVAAYSLGRAINVLNNAMTNTISPIVYRLIKEKRGRKALQKLSLTYSLIILVISVFTSILFYFFGEIILGAEYKNGVIVTCIILVAFGFNGMYRTVGLPLDYLKMNVLKTSNFTIAAIFNLIFSIALFDRFGFIAPAVGTLISFVLLYFFTLYFCIKHTQFLAD